MGDASSRQKHPVHNQARIKTPPPPRPLLILNPPPPPPGLSSYSTPPSFLDPSGLFDRARHAQSRKQDTANRGQNPPCGIRQQQPRYIQHGHHVSPPMADAPHVWNQSFFVFLSSSFTSASGEPVLAAVCRTWTFIFSGLLPPLSPSCCFFTRRGRNGEDDMLGGPGTYATESRK